MSTTRIKAQMSEARNSRILKIGHSRSIGWRLVNEVQNDQDETSRSISYRSSQYAISRRSIWKGRGSYGPA